MLGVEETKFPEQEGQAEEDRGHSGGYVQALPLD